LDHCVVQIKYQQKIPRYKNTHGTRKRKYNVKMFKDMEIMRLHKEDIRKRITENNEQQNNQNEETSETKWENIKKMVTVVANEMDGYEERRKRNDWYDKECQVKTKERNKAQIKMLNRMTRMNTEN
jgi:hypothetical protein